MWKTLIVIAIINFQSVCYSQSKYLFVEASFDMKSDIMRMPFFIPLNDSVDFAEIRELLCSNDSAFLSFCNSFENRVYLVEDIILAHSKVDEEYEKIMSNLEIAKSQKDILEIRHNKETIKFTLFNAKISSIPFTQMDYIPVFYFEEYGLSFNMKIVNLNNVVVNVLD